MLAALVAGALIGAGIGLALAGGDEDTDPLQGLRDARTSLGRAAAVLDIVPVEYAEGVAAGRVVRAAEYRGALSAITRSRDLYREARPVLAYAAPRQAARLDADYERLAGAAAARAPEQALESRARRLAAALKGALGTSG